MGMEVFDTPHHIALYRLLVTISYCEARARGMHMVDPRKARSVQLKNLRATYGITAKRWEQAVIELRELAETWKRDGVPEQFLVKNTDHVRGRRNSQDR